MAGKKLEMVKKKLKRDYSAVVGTNKEMTDFIEFLCDFVNEIEKEQRWRNVCLNLNSITYHI